MPSQQTSIKNRLRPLAALAGCLLLLSGCKILIQVPPGARVVSDNVECTAGAICEVDVTTTSFSEAFTVEPEPGYQFAGWRKAGRHLCGGSTAACAIDTSGFVGQPALLAFLDNDEIFYLAPRIVPANPSVSGKLTYDRVPQLSNGRGLDYNNITRMPIRGATVQLLRGFDEQILQETRSDADGAYAFTADSSDEVFVRVRAELLRQGTPEWDLSVRDNTQGGALYVLDGAQATIDDAAQRNLHAPSGWGGSRYTSERRAAPFALLDTMYGAQMRLVEIDIDINLPPLKVFWSENNSTAAGNLADGDIATSFYFREANESALYVLGKQDNDTDEYDVHIVVHEWIHYLEDRISRSDSRGGPHAEGDILDIRLAFSEGLGNGLAAVLLDNPWYVDTNGPGQQGSFSFSMESAARFNPGWFSETSVQALIYDLYDSNNDGADTLALGLRPIYHALTGAHKTTPALTSVFSFFDALLQNSPELAGPVSNMLEAERITGDLIDAYGSREQYRPSGDRNGTRSTLPVYRDLSVNGGAVEVCSQTHLDPFDEGNKLGVGTLVSFNVPTAGSYEVSVERTSGQLGSDPDFAVYANGQTVISGLTIAGDSESMQGRLNVGPHVLDVFGYYNTREPGTNNAGDACYSVTIESSGS
ncbi:hypothetical protein EY643_13915 [Halioglobus maricola]|uniref:Bacterial repeat domain-containing protein n=1 Tax=Halioglobus maricola TaxID=2601894 RepID=A0A5P9NLE9_9GAMM|nr:hypothetical protein [Halioglobus maricola]QFU76660.1 hypothetical protein EY643_13915 [Halioglobus maricola]